MSRTLILMRHAKSSWDDPRLADHDRPLNKRGRRSAQALGEWLRAGGWNPDEVLCSTARRTQDTLAGLKLAGAPVVLSRALYHAGPAELLAALHVATGRIVLMLGHNPGIAMLAQMLVREPPIHPRFDDYPTCATLVAKFDAGRWRDVTAGTGEVLGFVVPRDLI